MLTLFLILQALCVLLMLFSTMFLIRNELVYRARTKALDYVTNWNQDRIKKQTANHGSIEDSYAFLRNPGYNKMVYSFWDWNFDKMIDIENRISELEKIKII